MRHHTSYAVRQLSLAGLIVAAVVGPDGLTAETISVRHAEGITHGFLTLRDADGSLLANGDLIQRVQGVRGRTRLRFRFKDGSVYDETTVFSQRGRFRFVSDHLVQRGPTFPRQLEMQIRAGGDVTVRYTDSDGELKEEREHLDLPDDVANGMIQTLLKNVDPDAPPQSFSFVAATPKPRLVKLKVSSVGDERFTTAGAARSATHYVLKVEIGGLAGLVAPLFGKQPPDSHVWILGGEAPAFVRAEQPLFMDGPVWRIELAAPVWPATTDRDRGKSAKRR
jgi:hypothetical protein